MTELRYFLARLRPYGMEALLAILLGTAAVASNVGLLAVSAYLISLAALHPELYVLNVAIVGVRFFGISRAIFRYGERYVAHDVTFRLLGRLRTDAYGAATALPEEVQIGLAKGELLSRLIHAIEVLKFFYLQVAVPPVISLLLVIGLTVWLLALEPLLALLFISLTLAMIATVLVWSWQQRSAYEQLASGRSQVEAMMEDCLRSLREICAAGNEALWQEKISRTMAACEKQEAAAAHSRTASEALLYGLSQGLVLVILAAAVWLAEVRSFDRLYLAVVTLAAQSAQEAMQPLALFCYYWQTSQEAFAPLRRLLDGTAGEPVRKVCDAARPASPLFSQTDSRGILLDHLSFAYGQGPLVLDHLAFSFPPGSRTFLVGMSGAGKSTLAAILCGLIRPTKGQVYYDGEPIGEERAELLLAKVALISQHTHVFHASLRDNILLARPDATEDELLKAVEQAGLTELWEKRNSLHESEGAFSGQPVSGGEARRIAIARALLKNAPVILCDEAMSGLDILTAQSVSAAMDRAFQTKTVIIITHDLLTIDDKARVLLLADGKIAEAGTKGELLARKGLFYQAFCLAAEELHDRNFTAAVE